MEAPCVISKKDLQTGDHDVYGYFIFKHCGPSRDPSTGPQKCKTCGKAFPNLCSLSVHQLPKKTPTTPCVSEKGKEWMKILKNSNVFTFY